MIVSLPMASASTISGHGWNTCNKGWYKTGGTFENYCPNCGHHGTLVKGSKRSDEITCTQSRGGCDSDFCFCGKEKINHGASYLTKVNKVSTTKKVIKKVVVEKKLSPKEKFIKHITTKLKSGTSIMGIGILNIGGLNI